MVCSNCGAEIPEAAAFCPNCGAAAPAADARVILTPQGPRGRVGFSEDVNSPELQAALAKSRRITRITAAVLVVLPLVGFLIYGIVNDKIASAVPTGLIVSLVFLIVTLIVMLRRKLDRPFDGEVTEKRVKTGRRSRGDLSYSRRDYFLILRTDDGKRKKKGAAKTVFDSCRVGDRMRYHPEFAQPFEKYDKSGDAQVVCMMCARANPIENDHCSFCRNLLVR